MVTDYELI